MENLPQYKDVLQEICSYLTIFDIIRLSSTNRGFSKVLGQDYFKTLCEKSNINLKLNSLLHYDNWKLLYIDQVIYKFYNFILDDKYCLKFRKVDDSLHVIIGAFEGYKSTVVYNMKDYEKMYHYETNDDHFHVLAETIVSSPAMKELFFEGGLKHFKVLRHYELLFYNNQYDYGRPQKEVLSARKRLATLIQQSIYSVLKYGEVLFLVGRQIGHNTNRDTTLVDLDWGVELHCEHEGNSNNYHWMPEYLYYTTHRDYHFAYMPHPIFPKRLQEWIDNETDEEYYFVSIGPFIHDRIHNHVRRHVDDKYLAKYKRAEAEIAEMDKHRRTQDHEWRLLMETHVDLQDSDLDEDDEPVEEPTDELEIEDDLFCDEEDEDQPEDGN